MLDLNRLARDAGCLRRVGDRAEGFLGILLHACVVQTSMSLIVCVSVVNVWKRRQHRQRDGFGADPLGQGDAVRDSLLGQVRAVRRYQDVGIHRLFLGPLLDRGAKFFFAA